MNTTAVNEAVKLFMQIEDMKRKLTQDLRKLSSEEVYEYNKCYREQLKRIEEYHAR